MTALEPGTDQHPADGPAPRGKPGQIFLPGPLKISLAYLVFGLFWIVFSDRILLSLAKTQEESILISSIKGIFFIIVTTILLFLLARHFMEQMRAKNEKLRAQNAALASLQAESQNTFDAISDWIAVVNPDGRIIRSNKAVESLFGIPADRVFGRHCYEIVHGSPCPAADCPRIRMLKSRRREIAEILKNDGSGWLQVILEPVTGEDGRIVNAVHIVRDITERMRTQRALEQAKKKLNLLNYITFNDIQNMVFMLSAYVQLSRQPKSGTDPGEVFRKEEEILVKIASSLKFAQSCQDLGLRPARWQNASHVFLMAISHLDLRNILHENRLDDLEIFADPLLEQVFLVLASNTLHHGRGATKISVRFVAGKDTLTLLYEDNGPGLPADIKEKVFLPEFQEKKGVGLFLAKEILDITGITIRETGEPGKGARFEMVIPNGAFRFAALP